MDDDGFWYWGDNGPTNRASISNLGFAWADENGNVVWMSPER